MVGQVDDFDTIIVRSEFEALVLENSLIKQHMPRYNILLKDGKGYPFVRLSNEPYPPLLPGEPPGEGTRPRYFGPFGGRQETRHALDAIQMALKLPTCSKRFPRDIGKERPCLKPPHGPVRRLSAGGIPDGAEVPAADRAGGAADDRQAGPGDRGDREPHAGGGGKSPV